MPLKHVGGRRCIAPFILNLGARQKWLVNFAKRPLYVREMAQVAIVQEAGWGSQSRSTRSGEAKNPSVTTRKFKMDGAC